MQIETSNGSYRFILSEGQQKKIETYLEGDDFQTPLRKVLNVISVTVISRDVCPELYIALEELYQKCVKASHAQMYFLSRNLENFVYPTLFNLGLCLRPPVQYDISSLRRLKLLCSSGFIKICSSNATSYHHAIILERCVSLKKVGGIHYSYKDKTSGFTINALEITRSERKKNYDTLLLMYALFQTVICGKNQVTVLNKGQDLRVYLNFGFISHGSKRLCLDLTDDCQLTIMQQEFEKNRLLFAQGSS